MVARRINTRQKVDRDINAGDVGAEFEIFEFEESRNERKYLVASAAVVGPIAYL